MHREKWAYRTYLLGIDRGTRHVRDHGIASAPWVLGSSERVLLWRGLREPDVTAVSAEVAGLERISDILLDHDSATGGVDEPGAWDSQWWTPASKEGHLPFFILEMSSLLNKPRVFSCSGQLMVTTSHWASISSRFSTRRQPISFSFSGDSGW